MTRPVIALLSDFGTRDHYVGAMRGVILSVCPDATLVDITHEIDPQDVCGGAFELAAAVRYFPAGTIFLAVVDPGVGSERRAIAAEAGGQRFVAPDNGVLTAVWDEMAPSRVVELADPRYARSTISRTFEGRDRFAPAAGWMANGVDVTALGPSLSAWHLLDLPRPSPIDRGIEGQVVRVDRFGNLITNIRRESVVSIRTEGPLSITAGGHAVPQFVSTYAEANAQAPCALVGSGDCLEIAMAGGHAASSLGLGRGAVVRVTRR